MSLWPTAAHTDTSRTCSSRAGLFCIYVGGVYPHVGGFQPHEPTQMHERMTRKCDIWPHLTPLHTAHTHHTASVSQNNTPTVLCCRWQKRLLKDYGRAGHTDNIARTRRKLIRSVAFKLSANAMAPPSPILFCSSRITVMELFAS